MKVRFYPSQLKGAVTAPPSKSVAHRLLLSAGLAAGESAIENVALSEDVSATLSCLRAFGVETETEGSTLHIISRGLPTQTVRSALPCGACGSTLRFFLPLCMLTPSKTRLTGTPRLLRRPLSVYADICEAQGIPFFNDGKAVSVGEGLKSGEFRLPGNISSQFVSGLLFALPLTEGDSVISLTDGVESRPYIDLTLDALRLFGVEARWGDETTLLVPGGQRYAPANAAVEGDWSNAAFWFAMQTLGGEIDVKGLSEQSRQGDRICVSLLQKLQRENAVADIADCPDLGPVLMAFAAATGKGATFTGTRRLKLKESDRGNVMAAELEKFGIGTHLRDYAIAVLPGRLKAPDTPVCANDDHRIAMALSVLLLQTGGTLTGAQAVNKSYPDFFEKLASLGADIRIEEESPGAGSGARQ